MTVATFPRYASTELGSFVLWATCGYWSPARSKEPYAEDVETTVKRVLRLLEAQGVNSVETLGKLAVGEQWTENLLERVQHVRLRTRLREALKSFQDEDTRSLSEDARLTAGRRRGRVGDGTGCARTLQ